MQQGYAIPVTVALIAILFLYLIFSPSRTQYSVHSENTLVRAVIFYRHGDRSPVTTYPTDPHPFTDKKKWPADLQGLTKKGKKDAFYLGKLFRRRYKNFLPLEYNPTDIISYSTNVERTLSSAAIVLAGLYPPTDQELWIENLPWHPIPVYGDIIFNEKKAGMNCPRYVEEVWSLFTQNNVTFFQENEQLFNFLSQHTKLNFTGNPFTTLIFLTDCLIMQSRSGLQLPDWTEGVFPQKLLPLMSDVFNDYLITTEVQLQLTGAVLLNRIYDLFKLGKRKMYLNSAHDITLMMLENALGASKPIRLPEPTSSIIFELHNIAGNSIVKAFKIENSRSEYFEPLQMGCGAPQCSLQDFEELSTNYTVDNYETLCHDISEKYHLYTTLEGFYRTPFDIPIF